MVDEALLDLTAAAVHAGLSVADLQALVASGAIVTSDDDHVTRHVITSWVEQDRAARRRALAALATGIAAEVFY